MSGTHQYAQCQGDPGAVVLYIAKVSPGDQIPVVVGAGGAGGSYANTNSWQSYMNGGDGGASSFADVSASGGPGGGRLYARPQFTNSGSSSLGGSPSYVANGCIIYRRNATDLSWKGNNENGWGTVIGVAGSGGAPGTSYNSGNAGSDGFVGVFW